MPDQHQKPSAAPILMAAILTGAVMIALVGAFIPGWIGLTGAPAIIIQVVFYAVALIDVAVAFWLRAKLRKAQQSRPQTGTVRRQ